MIFLFSFIALIKSESKNKIIYLYAGYTEADLADLKQSFEQSVRQNYDYCISMGLSSSKCEKMLSALDDVSYTNKDGIDKTLEQVSNNADVILIAAYEFSGTIDFNVLKKKVNIIYTSPFGNEDISYNDYFTKQFQKMINFSYDGNISKIIKYEKSLENKKLKKPRAYSTLSFDGNIKDKIPFLYISGVNIKIINNDLNGQNTAFISAQLDKSSKCINSTYFLVDYETHSLLNMNKINVEQYCIYLLEGNQEITDYQISYYSQRWGLLGKDVDESKYSDLNLYVPYTSAKYYGIMVIATCINIDCSFSSTLVTLNDLNLTIIESLNIPSILEGRKHTVKITSSGWAGQNKKPKVYITTDENKFNIDKSEASDLEIEIYKQGQSNEDKKSGMKKSILIGIIVGFVAVAIIIIVIIIVVAVKKRRRVEGAQQS